MKPKQALKTLAPLLKKPHFTTRESAQLGIKTQLLSYYVKIGLLERLGRGLYRGIDSPPVEDFHWEDMVHALARVKGGVVCLISALALYDLTDEIPRQHWIAIRNQTRHRGDPSIKIIRMRNMELGRTTINIDNITIDIFDRERTILDAFKFLSKETAIKALKEAVRNKGDEKLDLEKVRQYAKILHINIQPYLLMVKT